MLCVLSFKWDLHVLVRTSDCPKLTSDTKQYYIDFVDNMYKLSYQKKMMQNCTNLWVLFKSTAFQDLKKISKMLDVDLIFTKITKILLIAQIIKGTNQKHHDMAKLCLMEKRSK